MPDSCSKDKDIRDIALWIERYSLPFFCHCQSLQVLLQCF